MKILTKEINKESKTTTTTAHDMGAQKGSGSDSDDDTDSSKCPVDSNMVATFHSLCYLYILFHFSAVLYNVWIDLQEMTVITNDDKICKQRTIESRTSNALFALFLCAPDLGIRDMMTSQMAG